MAFCNAALVANLVASIMVSGVCCIHSMHEEEERKKEHKETLKEAISMEWERQRQKDREHRERIVKEARIEAGARLAEERRRYLIYAKTRATTQAFSATRKRSRAGSGSTGNKSTRTTTTCQEIPRYSLRTQRRVRSDPLYAPRHYSSGSTSSNKLLPFTIQNERYDSEMSSLLDDYDDDESLEEIIFL